MDILDVHSPVRFDDSISNYEYHTYAPYNTTRFENNDEIRIGVQFNELNLLIAESSLRIRGRYVLKDDENTRAPEVSHKINNNGILHMFEQIRYELNGVEIERCKKVGVSTLMKGLVSMPNHKNDYLYNVGWIGLNEAGKTLSSSANGGFDINIPLKMIFGFAEDYKKIVINCKHELILTRANTDYNAYTQPAGTAATATVAAVAETESKIIIDKIEWLIPHVQLSNEYKILLLRNLNKTIKVPFRSFELYEIPMLPRANHHVWYLKTSSQLEKPRYAIIGLQTNRNNNRNINSSHFDNCNLTNVKFYLNSMYYPYDNLNLDFDKNEYSLLYEMYCKFIKSYYGNEILDVGIGKGDFKNKAPLVVIDCSKQNDSLKNAPVDVKIELSAKENFPDNTAVYCLIIHDRIVEYNPITSEVKVAV